MKETGLMFKAPLVRAILDRSKTQTRRLVKLQPAPNTPHDGGTKWIAHDGLHVPVGSVGHLSLRDKQGIRCPMGQPGDRIYVRETFAMDDNGDYEWPVYRADGSPLPVLPPSRGPSRWKPAIHMPKAQARTWLEITGVRVERLQDISEVDCRAEGAHGGHGSIPGYAYSATPQEHFQHIWESTGGDWAANPCVWVIDFKQIPLPREQGS